MSRTAYLPKIGRVRVLAYKGDGYFEVLDRHDNRRLVHRNRLTFTPTRKEN